MGIYWSGCGVGPGINWFRDSSVFDPVSLRAQMCIIEESGQVINVNRRYKVYLNGNLRIIFIRLVFVVRSSFARPVFD